MIWQQLNMGDMAQEVRAVVWQSEGCRFDPSLGVSKCPWARHLTPNCSWRAGWCLAWQPIAIGVWMYGWMRGINCTVLWIKALYKCHLNVISVTLTVEWLFVSGLSISETDDPLGFSHTTVSRVRREWCKKTHEQQFCRQKHLVTEKREGPARSKLTGSYSSANNHAVTCTVKLFLLNDETMSQMSYNAYCTFTSPVCVLH